SSLLYINRFLEPLDYIEPNQVYAREFSVRDNSLKAISNVSIAESTGSGRFVAAKVNKTNFKLTSTAPLPKGIYGVTVKLEGSTDDGKKIVKNFYRAINVGFTDESSAPETPKLFITSPISGNVTSNVQVSGVATGVSKLTVTYTCASQRGSVDVVPVPNTGAWTTSLSLKLCSVGNIVIISASGISPDGMVVVAPSVRVTRR
ncbi:MAG TPA: hypothetical protein VEA59_00830, partial [Patescibacteria group bacterium]|nr:hypothetical protein [Patescibacteria group bacterium]